MTSRRTQRLTLFGLTVLACMLAVTVWSVVRTPVALTTSPLLINDVTQLNPVRVSRVVTPTTIDEIIAAVKGHDGFISIGGAHHSMGGQIASSGALYLDMRRFDRILDFSPAERMITVQAGARWRQIQERIDPANLSVAIMQTYANFTIGGSLSVNVHGRYVGLGPIIQSVKSLKVVLADGSVVDASPAQNAAVFNGVIGGYGGLGVMAEATLELTDNVKVKREDRTVTIAEYRRFFDTRIRPSGAVFHNGDIYPDAYDTVHAVTYSKTDDPVTVADRLIPEPQSYRLHRFVYWAVSEWPFGHALRRHVVDPVVYRDEPVTWRNYEASYDTAELEPASRAASTYVLQEYFVPVDRFDDFVPRMRAVLQRHHVHAINISIRHAEQDPGSLLAWARSEVFGFVIYHKQGTTAADRQEVSVWTRALIDSALSVGGSYYLAYQVHASDEQFRQAYPRADEFFELKRRLDPTNKFRNALWDRYFHP